MLQDFFPASLRTMSGKKVHAGFNYNNQSGLCIRVTTMSVVGYFWGGSFEAILPPDPHPKFCNRCVFLLQNTLSTTVTVLCLDGLSISIVRADRRREWFRHPCGTLEQAAAAFARQEWKVRHWRCLFRQSNERTYAYVRDSTIGHHLQSTVVVIYLGRS